MPYNKKNSFKINKQTLINLKAILNWNVNSHHHMCDYENEEEADKKTYATWLITSGKLKIDKEKKQREGGGGSRRG